MNIIKNGLELAGSGTSLLGIYLLLLFMMICHPDAPVKGKELCWMLCTQC